MAIADRGKSHDQNMQGKRSRKKIALRPAEQTLAMSMRELVLNSSHEFIAKDNDLDLQICLTDLFLSLRGRAEGIVIRTYLCLKFSNFFSASESNKQDLPDRVLDLPLFSL